MSDVVSLVIWPRERRIHNTRLTNKPFSIAPSFEVIFFVSSILDDSHESEGEVERQPIGTNLLSIDFGAVA